MTTVDRLLPLAFGLDRLAHCLRVVDVIGPKARVTVELDGAELPPVIEHRVDLPAGARRDATLRLTLAEGRARPRVWEGRLDALNDATPPTLAVSKVRYDALRGTLQVGGWTAGIAPSARIALFRAGQEVGVARRGVPRPDVAKARGLMLPNCGFQLIVALEPGGGGAFELRATDAIGRPLTIAVLPTPATLSTAGPALLPRLAARAAAMPRARLERLIASEPFRRRWQGGVTTGLPPDGPCWLAREAVVAALVGRLRPGEEIAVRLVDGDRVLCRPVDDSILARRYLIDGQDEIGFMRWLAGRVGPGDTAIDAGAAYGVMSRTMARRGARVIAVEADALAADRIRRAGLVQGAGRIELVEAALSATEGEVVFAGMGGSSAGSGKVLADDRPATLQDFLDEVSGLNQVPLSVTGSQVKERRRFGHADVHLRRVPALTLDGLCAAHTLRDVAVVKIDIEGGELEALRGGAGLLDGAFGRPPVVAFEYSALFPTRAGQREDVLDLFLTRGWTLWRLEGGKGRGGMPVAVADAAAAPAHDNLIAMPPGGGTP